MSTCDTHPFSGCKVSQQLFETIVKTLNVSQVIETGTYRGHTTSVLSTLVPQVITIENNPVFYSQAKERFSSFPNVTVLFGDSGQLLKSCYDSSKTTLFYLDAHWDQKNPLLEEIKAILSQSSGQEVIIIDDFQVPNRDFSYDMHPPTLRHGRVPICLDLVSPLFDWTKWEYFYKSRGDNPGCRPTGQIFIFHKSLHFPKELSKIENGIPFLK